jgi:soluble cytochrome b562
MGGYHSSIKKAPIDKKDEASETVATKNKKESDKKNKPNLDKEGIKDFITQHGLEECQKLVNDGDFAKAVKSLNKIIKILNYQSISTRKI